VYHAHVVVKQEDWKDDLVEWGCVEPMRLLPKSGFVVVVNFFPFIRQSDESSMTKKKVRKVKKQPELSLRKLQPLSCLKHLTESKGHGRLGTCSTSRSMMIFPPKERHTVSTPRQAVLLLSAYTAKD